MEPSSQFDIIRIVLNGDMLQSKWVSFLCFSIGVLLLVKALRYFWMGLVYVLRVWANMGSGRSSDEL